MIEIVYGHEKYFESFQKALDSVAKERQYIEMIEAPPLAGTIEFQRGNILKNAPVYYAVDENKVVGWCEISLKDNPRLRHRGTLGMGLISGYRNKGLGTRLMQAALEHAKKSGLERVELTVYTTNPAAQALYAKMGFVAEGMIYKYRKLDGVYYDAIFMTKDIK